MKFNCEYEQESNKPIKCNNMCESEKEKDRCNYCIDKDRIFFSGICDANKFTLTKFWTEIIVNGTVTVPKEKLSIEEIDSINAKVEILRKKVIITPVGRDDNGNTKTIKNYEGKNSTGRKLIVEGLICLSISYVTLTKDQSVNRFHGKIPFSAFIVLEKDSCLDIDYLVLSCLEEICVKKVCNRSVDLSVALLLNAVPVENECNDEVYKNYGVDCNNNVGFSLCKKCNCFENIPVIKGICEPQKIDCLLKDNSRYWNEIFVPEILTIPECKPNINQVLTVTSSVKVMCQKVIETPRSKDESYEGLSLTGRKVIIQALLRQRITYVSDKECKSVHSAHFDIPISLYLVVPNTTEFIEKFKVETCIEDIYACVLNGRQLFKNTTLFVKIKPIEC